MKIDQIKKVLVVGAGLMGSGISQVFAQAGYQVFMGDVSAVQLEKARRSTEKSLDSLVARGKLGQGEKADIIARITPVQELTVAREVDFVVEAVSENKDLKANIFGQLDGLCRPEVILATNTSSIPITEIAATTNRPHQVIGTHFMSPVPLMPVVEVIRALQTGEEVYGITVELMRRIGKEPADSNDFPGFISNRIFMSLINEAIYCVYEGMGTAENIDKIVKLSFNHPMGPLRLADAVGLDTILNVLEVLYSGYRNPKYAPCPLLVNMVKAGWLGKKSGRGFYQYDA